MSNTINSSKTFLRGPLTCSYTKHSLSISAKLQAVNILYYIVAFISSTNIDNMARVILGKWSRICTPLSPSSGVPTTVRCSSGLSLVTLSVNRHVPVVSKEGPSWPLTLSRGSASQSSPSYPSCYHLTTTK